MDEAKRFARTSFLAGVRTLQEPMTAITPRKQTVGFSSYIERQEEATASRSREVR